MDFTISGTALLSSSTIHRMKSESILKMEEPPKPPTPRPNETVPPPLPLPIRYEYTSTSVSEVLRALEQVILKESLLSASQKLVTSVPSVMEQLDEFLVNIQEHIDRFYRSLIELSRKAKIASFKKITEGYSKLETVRIFIMLLFLACNDKVFLWQDENSDDIRITVQQAMGDVSATQ